jgi:HAD superfamily hydrolase (TIGR01549 family)
VVIRAVSFDHWGTLVDADHSNKGERLGFLGRYLPAANGEQIAQAWDRSWERFHKLLFSGLSPSTPTFLSFVLDELGIALEPDAYAQVVGYWQAAMLDAPPRLLPGVVEVLEAVRARGLRVGLISDTGVTPGSVLKERLRQTGLLPYFDHLTFSDEIGVTKTRQYPFRHTAQALGVSVADMLHVGDLPETDIRGGRAAGCRTALLLEVSDRRDGIPDADLVLEHLTDLPTALDKL